MTTSTTTSYDRLLDALRDHGSNVVDKGDTAMAQCPAHADGRPSLSVKRIDESVLLYCFAGCSTDAVTNSLTMTVADLFDSPRGTTYSYPDGRRVHRSPDKRFSQSGNTKGRSLYRADRIAHAETVFVVEGEKDVHAIESVGGVAVCSAMGAGKANKFDWTPLSGKTVYIVADRDEPGQKHALQVADLLRALGNEMKTPTRCSIVVAAVGKDAADHIAAGKTLDEFVSHEDDVDGAQVLDDVRQHYARYIRVTDDADLHLLVLWTVSTHLAVELYTTPRLQIDSTMPGSGKTTVLDHLNRLACRPVQAATLSSPALIPRLLENGTRTILLDEVDRSLRPDKPGVADLIGILNSGYRRGATRPVLVPVKGGGWEVMEMPTFSPVAMAGNSPNLPDDTKSRSLRLLLMPDLDGSVEDSDWELIEDETEALRGTIAAFADSVRERVAGLTVELPAGCIGRSKEKWRPLKRVAVVAGGHWPTIADELISRNMAEDAHERDAGLRNLPPGMVLLTDLHAVWPAEQTFVATRELVSKLIFHNPDYWGLGSPYGKALTEKRFGQLIVQASRVTSQRPGGVGSRGYLHADLVPVWARLRISGTPPGESGGPGESGESGGLDLRINQNHQVHRINQDTPGLCPDCKRAPARSDSGKCDFCTARQRATSQNGH